LPVLQATSGNFLEAIAFAACEAKKEKKKHKLHGQMNPVTEANAILTGR